MRNRRTRQFLAVLMVTGALYADRAAAAVPSAKPVMGQMASRFVGKLTRNLGHAVQGVKLHQHRPTNDQPMVLVVAAPVEAPPSHRPITPFQFRLPPPLI